GRHVGGAHRAGGPVVDRAGQGRCGAARAGSRAQGVEGGAGAGIRRGVVGALVGSGADGCGDEPTRARGAGMRRREFLTARFEEHLDAAMPIALPALMVVATVLVLLVVVKLVGWVALVALLVLAAPFEYAGVRALLDLRRRNRRPG